MSFCVLVSPTWWITIQRTQRSHTFFRHHDRMNTLCSHEPRINIPCVGFIFLCETEKSARALHWVMQLLTLKTVIKYQHNWNISFLNLTKRRKNLYFPACLLDQFVTGDTRHSGSGSQWSDSPQTALPINRGQHQEYWYIYSLLFVCCFLYSQQMFVP